MAIDTTAPRSRRAILAGALGGAGAMLAATLGRAAPVAAANGDPVSLGKGTTATDNAATASTIVNGGASNPTLGAKSTTGAGVFGNSGAAPPGDTDFTQTGVYGFADIDAADAGVWGDTIQGIGVVGTGDWGVAGFGFVGGVGSAPETGTGLHGFAGTGNLNVPAAGTAIHGHAGPGATTGIYASASSPTQTALYVSGGFKTSRSGRRNISASATSLKVTVPGATAGSWAIATLQTSVSGCYVRAAVTSTNAVTIYLSKAPGKTVAVGYLVVN
ncbi:MAG TPA: hypothetical protein VH440_11130 [Candidatus Limnocylindrales bacterium]